MPRPKSHKRRDHKVSGCLTQEAAEALEHIMAENPYQTKSNVISKAIAFFYKHSRYGLDANLDPLPQSMLRTKKGGRP